MSVKFLSAILGPEMAAPILWAPRISAFFLQIHKVLVLGGYFGFGGGGGKCRFYFYGRGDFSDIFMGAEFSETKLIFMLFCVLLSLARMDKQKPSPTTKKLSLRNLLRNKGRCKKQGKHIDVNVIIPNKGRGDSHVARESAPFLGR